MIADINLLPKKEKPERSPKLVIYIALAAFLLIGLYLYFMYSSEKKAHDLLASTNEQILVEAEQVKLEVDRLIAMRDQSRGATVGAVEGLIYPTAPIIEDSVSRLPKNSYLREMEFKPDAVTMITDFEDKTTISLYVEDLASSSVFTTVQITEIKGYDLAPNAEDRVFYDVVPRYSTEFLATINRQALQSKGAEN